MYSATHKGWDFMETTVRILQKHFSNNNGFRQLAVNRDGQQFFLTNEFENKEIFREKLYRNQARN